MDEDTATRFVSSLVKSIQALCNGYIDFSSSIEVIGHIHLNIDRNMKFNYILTEEVSKSESEDATLFASHSYHSKPPSSVSGKDPNGSNSKPSRRKTHQVPRVDDSEPDTLIVTSLPKDIPSASSHSGGNDTHSQAGSFSSLQDSNTSFSMKPERQQASSTHVRDSPDRRRRSTVLSPQDTSSPAVKRNRNSDSNSSSAVQKTDFGVIEIKEEPQDDPPLCFEGSASDVPSEHDIQTPDFSNVVMESLDRVGQIEGTQLVGAGEVMPVQQQQHQQPFPVMLHASPVVPLSGVPASSFIHPGPSTESQHVASTSGETVAGRRVRKPTSRAVQTPYDLKACMKKAARTKKREKKPARSPAKNSSGEAGATSAPRRPKASTRKPKITRPKKKLGRRYSANSGYRAYTEEDVLEAIELVHGGVPVIDAALKYGIPRATLFIRSRQGCKTHTGRCSEVFSRTHGGQPSIKKHKKMHYTQEAVDKAIQAVHGGMPVIDASILYGIPRASLFIRSAKGCPSHPGRCSTVFSNGKLRRTKAPKNKYQKLHKQASKIHNKEETEESASFEVLEGVPVVHPVTGEVLTFKTEPEDEAFIEYDTSAESSLQEAQSAQDAAASVPQDTAVSVPGTGTSSGLVYGMQPVSVVVKIEKLDD